MISIPITEVKLFMNHLLCRSTFDAFCVPELSLSTFASFHMDGHILKDYYTKEEYETLYKDRTPIARWKQLRPVCFELIRGTAFFLDRPAALFPCSRIISVRNRYFFHSLRHQRPVFKSAL